MAVVRKRNIGTRTYYYLVHSYRSGGMVRKKVHG